MKKIYILFVFIVSNLTTFSQHEADYWYFGFNAGMHFVGGVPVAITDGALYGWEGCSALSDHNGNLMFYTDGKKVWNKIHQIMPNGNGLHGDSSSTQSGMIVELPGGNKLYYLFTVDDLAGPNGLKYSIIDMNQDSMNGDVIMKNAPLHTPVSEKVSATYHSNNTDVWVLAHEWGTNAFYAYLVNPSGVSTTPVISNVGTTHIGGTSPNYNSAGYMKFSPDGSRIALTVLSGYIEVFDFDASTGVVSNPILFPSITGWAYGIEFSPDNSKLYVANIITPHKLYQYDLNAGTPTDIINSQVVIATSTSVTYRGLQLGPDFKIYLSRQDQTYLGVINNPNNLGAACNYVELGFYLGGKIAQYGLPNFMPSYFNNTVSIENISSNNDINIYPNPANNLVNITLPNKFILSGLTTITINDINSRQLIKQQISSENTEVNITCLSNGVYIVKVYNNENVIVKKLIKQ